MSNEIKVSEDVQCPACGFYCLGKGGYGCIDKPSMMKTKDAQSFDVDQLRTEALALAQMLKSEIQNKVISAGADYGDPLEFIPEWQAAQRFIERYQESS